MKKLYEELDVYLSSDQEFLCEKFIQKYLLPPYGLNEYSLALFLFTYFANRSYKIKLEFDSKRYSISNWSKIVVYDSMIDFKVYNKTKVVKFDSSEISKKYEILFKNIEKNEDISMVLKYDNELSNLIEQSDVPNELTSSHKLAQMKLNDGKSAYEEYKERIGKLEYRLDDSIKDNDIHALINMLSYDLDTKNIFESKGYSLTNEQNDKFYKIEDKCRVYIEKNIEDWILRQKCYEIGAINSYEKK